MTITTANTYQSYRSFQQANHDGSFRFTMLWKVNDMTTHTIDQANKLFQELMTDYTAHDDFMIHPWLSSNPKKQPLVTHTTIRDTDILTYASDKVLSIPDKKLYIVTFRVSVASQISVFLKRFKPKLDHYFISIRISNASPDAGPVSFAGEILYKHPRHTHRLRYTQYLRSLLPDDCPPFDIEYQHGRNNEPARLKVNCGQNHIEPLGGLLCKLLTGPTSTSNQPFFLSRMQSSTMSRQELDKLYSRHLTYLDGSTTVPVPLYSNLDTQRTTTLPNGSTHVLSLREWVNQLKLPNGQPAFCDIDKGTGHVVIICPRVHKDYVQLALNKFCDTLRNSHQRQQWQHPIPESIFLKDILSGSSTNVPNPWANPTTTTRPNSNPPSPSAPPPPSPLDATQFPPLCSPNHTLVQSTLTPSQAEVSALKLQFTNMQAELSSIKDILQSIQATSTNKAQSTPAAPSSAPPTLSSLNDLTTRQLQFEQFTSAELHRIRSDFTSIAQDLRQSLRDDMKEMLTAFASQPLPGASPAPKRSRHHRTTDPDGYTKASVPLCPPLHEDSDDDEPMSQATDLLPPSPPPPASQNTPPSPGSEEASL
jgi:hypothetical protein